MNVALLIPFVKPFVKQIFDSIVVPELSKLIAQIPNADVAALAAKIQADVDAEVDKLLS